MADLSDPWEGRLVRLRCRPVGGPPGRLVGRVLCRCPPRPQVRSCWLYVWLLEGGVAEVSEDDVVIVEEPWRPTRRLLAVTTWLGEVAAHIEYADQKSRAALQTVGNEETP